MICQIYFVCVFFTSGTLRYSKLHFTFHLKNDIERKWFNLVVTMLLMEFQGTVQKVAFKEGCKRRCEETNRDK